MDQFSYTVFTNTLTSQPSAYDIDTFEEILLTLSSEDIEEVFHILTDKVHSADESKQKMRLLQVLWHYR